MTNIRGAGIKLEPSTGSLADGTNALRPTPPPGVDTTGGSRDPVATPLDFPELSGKLLRFSRADLQLLARHRREWRMLVERAETTGKMVELLEIVRDALAPLGESTEPTALQPWDGLRRIYDSLCRMEYDEIDAELKKAFDDQSTANKIEPTWRYYQYLRPGYVRLGFEVPSRVINQIDPQAKFLGRSVWAGLHPKFRDKLAQAEEQLRQQGHLVRAQQEMGQKHSERSLGHFGGFVPRYQASRYTRGRWAGLRALSNHAFGLAIDLEHPTNPMLAGSSSRAIDALLDHLQKTGAPGLPRARKPFSGWEEMSMEDYDRMKSISDAVVAFLREWIPRWERTRQTRRESGERIGRAEDALSSTSMDAREESRVAESLSRNRDAYLDAERERKSHKEYDLLETLFQAWATRTQSGLQNAKFFAKHGLITIPQTVFRALKAVGVQSGLEYRGSKDTMHFEYPGDVVDVLGSGTR